MEENRGESEETVRDKQIKVNFFYKGGIHPQCWFSAYCWSWYYYYLFKPLRKEVSALWCLSSYNNLAALAISKKKMDNVTFGFNNRCDSSWLQ